MFQLFEDCLKRAFRGEAIFGMYVLISFVTQRADFVTRCHALSHAVISSSYATARTRRWCPCKA